MFLLACAAAPDSAEPDPEPSESADSTGPVETGDSSWTDTAEPDVELGWTGDFHGIAIGCVASGTLSIANRGTDTLLIARLAGESASDEFRVGFVATELAPGESQSVGIDYEPVDAGDDLVTLRLETDDPDEPSLALELSASGVGEVQTERFVAPAQTADILVVVDDTPSMTPESDHFTELAQAFVERAGAYDWQLGLITTNDPALRGPVLHSSDAGLVPALVEQFPTDFEGASTAGSDRARTCLDGGDCAGLLRGAPLHLVHLTDGYDESADPWDEYVAFYRTLAEEARVHAMGGDYPAGCGGAPAAEGYYEQAVETDGLFSSICSSWWGDFGEALADAIPAPHGDYVLAAVPVPETLRVAVDGVATATGWAVDGATLHFDEAPAEGAEILVQYVADAC